MYRLNAFQDGNSSGVFSEKLSMTVGGFCVFSDHLAIILVCVGFRDSCEATAQPGKREKRDYIILAVIL